MTESYYSFNSSNDEHQQAFNESVQLLNKYIADSLVSGTAAGSIAFLRHNVIVSKDAVNLALKGVTAILTIEVNYQTSCFEVSFFTRRNSTENCVACKTVALPYDPVKLETLLSLAQSMEKEDDVDDIRIPLSPR
ncbi:MAG: hypothetical protein JSS53_02910 [Proteobacteria bacterium]|nr:hypothetical protein [Pseudomonadota bacterium]